MTQKQGKTCAWSQYLTVEPLRPMCYSKGAAERYQQGGTENEEISYNNSMYTRVDTDGDFWFIPKFIEFRL